MTIYEVWPRKDWRYCGFTTREQAESCLKEAKDCGCEDAEIREAEVRDINMAINEERRLCKMTADELKRIYDYNRSEDAPDYSIEEFEQFLKDIEYFTNQTENGSQGE